MIELQDQVSTSSTPVIKAQRIGEIARIALVRWEQRAMMRDGAAVINAKTGKPRQELVVHGIALAGTTAVAGIGDMQDVPTPGTPCRFILRGGGYGQWIEARKAHRNGRLLVGDTVTRIIEYAQPYDAAGAPKGPRLTDQFEVERLPRSTTVGFYGSMTLEPGTDPAIIAAAETAYRNWQDSQRISAGGDDIDEFA
jgi:hypothetical protein